MLQILVSIRDRKKNLDTTGDPWNGRTLEWATPSPPLEYNFAVIPHVHDRDAFWTMKHARSSHKPHYEDILMPKNSPLPVFIGSLSFLLGFCLIWHIMWLAGVSLLGIIVCMVIRLSEKETEHLISAEKVAELERSV